ncbi:MAG: permease [Prochloraceae cyanobacterium]|nr:permease [Prochloraceae cyanobacterium]
MTEFDLEEIRVAVRAFTLFLSLLAGAIPFLLLGILLSSLLMVSIDKLKANIHFPRNPILGAIFGSFLGLLLPVGQYGNLPVARRLLLEGIPKAVAMSFLVAAPTLNPVTIWLTWTAFSQQPKIFFLRILFIWLIAIIIGCIFSARLDRKYSRQIEETKHLEDGFNLLRTGTFLLVENESKSLYKVGKLSYGYKQHSPNKKSFSGKLNLILDNSIRELVELGAVLVIGCAIATFIQIVFSQTQIFDLAQSPATRIIALLLLGIVLSIGSIGNTLFIATLSSDFTGGSVLAFLLFSSIVDLKSSVSFLWVFRLRVAIYLSIVSLLLTFLLSLAIDFYVS